MTQSEPEIFVQPVDDVPDLVHPDLVAAGPAAPRRVVVQGVQRKDGRCAAGRAPDGADHRPEFGGVGAARTRALETPVLGEVETADEVAVVGAAVLGRHLDTGWQGLPGSGRQETLSDRRFASAIWI